MNYGMVKKPSVGHLRVFGSTAFVHVAKEDRQKLDAKSDRCIFIGYSESKKAWRFWNPNTKNVKVSRDAVFYEKETFNENVDDSSVISLAQPASSNEEAEEIQQSPTEVIDQAPVTVSNLTNSRSGRPQRERKAPAWIRSGDFDLLRPPKWRPYPSTQRGR